MKNLFLLSLIVIIWCLPQFSMAQVFVNHAATGANDGTSWSDAYTNLQSALSNASIGDRVWIAAGTYTPAIDGDTVDAYFQFLTDIELYGGFNGTETDLSQRDWLTNETILSGDHNGDDIDDDFIMNRGDNSRHVMWLTDTITSTTLIDGITFRNGNTEPAAGSGDDRRGGGILTYGAPTIRNCSFTQNYGYFGAALYPRGTGASGISITNCSFDRNRGRSGGCIYMNSRTGTIKHCSFSNNVAENLAGAIYNNTASGALIDSCVFMDNSALDSRGGAIYNTETPSAIINCSFLRNTALSSSGGAVQIRNSDETNPVITVYVSNCEFENNRATWGGAIGCYDDQSIGMITDCTFRINSSVNTGGAISNAFGATTQVEHCEFLENNSSTGGAIYSQNDSSIININNSYFEENSAEIGGAIAMSGDNEPLSLKPLPLLNLSNTTILLNTSVEQAGAINMSNSNLDMSNTLISFNLVLNVDGIGGAISFNTSDSIHTESSMINSTLVNNAAFIGAGLATWVQDATASGDLHIQNTILSNPDGLNYEVELGAANVVSNGGNLSTDNSLDMIFTNTNDLNATDPLFVEPFTDQHLLDNSPCVNTGIAAGAPATDIEGSPRLGQVDMGAYENQNVVGVRNQSMEAFGKLNVFPNPVKDELNYEIENNWKGLVSVRLVDVKGMDAIVHLVEKDMSYLSGSLKTEDLPGGMYHLIITNGVRRSVQKIIK